MGKHHFRIQYIIKGQQCRLWITPPEQKNMMNKTQLEMHLKKKHRTVNTQFQGSHSKTENIAVLAMDGTDRRRRMKLEKNRISDRKIDINCCARTMIKNTNCCRFS
jgi:hypothetical protein